MSKNEPHTGMNPIPVIHPLEPVFDAHSRILVLGTMPSPASRTAGFYYMHPQNRFWPVLTRVFAPGCAVPQSVCERQAFARMYGIALWDVLHACTIRGAGDSTIRDPVPNDLNRILSVAPIRRMYTTGRKAKELYDRYCRPATGREAIVLPSPSSANCAVSLDRLVEVYTVMRMTNEEMKEERA